MLNIPDMIKLLTSEYHFISQAIGTITRGFTAEIRVPKGINLRPNQIAYGKNFGLHRSKFNCDSFKHFANR